MVSEFTMKNALDLKTKTTNPPNPHQVRKNFVILILILILIIYSHFNIFNIDFWDVNINMKMTPDFNKKYRNQCNLGWVGGVYGLSFSIGGHHRGVIRKTPVFLHRGSKNLTDLTILSTVENTHQTSTSAKSGKVLSVYPRVV